MLGENEYTQRLRSNFLNSPPPIPSSQSHLLPALRVPPKGKVWVGGCIGYADDVEYQARERTRKLLEAADSCRTERKKLEALEAKAKKRDFPQITFPAVRPKKENDHPLPFSVSSYVSLQAKTIAQENAESTELFRKYQELLSKDCESPFPCFPNQKKKKTTPQLLDLCSVFISPGLDRDMNASAIKVFNVWQPEPEPERESPLITRWLREYEHKRLDRIPDNGGKFVSITPYDPLLTAVRQEPEQDYSVYLPKPVPSYTPSRHSSPVRTASPSHTLQKKKRRDTAIPLFAIIRDILRDITD